MPEIPRSWMDYRDEELPRWLIEWMSEQQESRAVLIEDALTRRHKLKPPEGT